MSGRGNYYDLTRHLYAADRPAAVPRTDDHRQPLEAGLGLGALTPNARERGFRFSKKAAIASLTSADSSRSANMALSSFIRSRISSLRAGAQQPLGLAQRLRRLGRAARRRSRSSLASSSPAAARWLTRPIAMRFIDSERFAEQQIARGAAPAGEPRQQQRARRFGHQAKIDERQREARAVLGDDEVAMEQHGRADAHAIAVDRGDDRDLACRRAREAAATPGFPRRRAARPRGNRRDRCRRRSPGPRRGW